MGRAKSYWELKEEELLAKENAYLNDYNWFEQLIDNHYTFVLFFVISLMFGFVIGFLIGMML